VVRETSRKPPGWSAAWSIRDGETLANLILCRAAFPADSSTSCLAGGEGEEDRCGVLPRLLDASNSASIGLRACPRLLRHRRFSCSSPSAPTSSHFSSPPSANCGLVTMRPNLPLHLRQFAHETELLQGGDDDLVAALQRLTVASCCGHLRDRALIFSNCFDGVLATGGPARGGR